MIDCGGGNDNWPSRLLNANRINNKEDTIPTNDGSKYGIDALVVSHPHGDHLSDLASIHDTIGFRTLYGGYNSFIDNISDDAIDWRKRGKTATNKFRQIVKNYTNPVSPDNRVGLSKSDCVVEHGRFISYSDGVDLNDISYLVTFTYKGQKILFPGDLTASAVSNILKSSKASGFREFVKGTTILKVPHHGRDNGCSEELFNLFGGKPLICLLSDEALNQRNEGTANTAWYTARTSDTQVSINGVLSNRKVLTTRSDKDIFLSISSTGDVTIQTNYFKDVRPQILEA
jgi:hypothetical protein